MAGPVPIRTSLKELPNILNSVRLAAKSGKAKSVEFRKDQLKALLALYEDNEELLIKSLYTDLGKPRMEAITTELDRIKNEIKNALMHIHDWTKPSKKERNLITLIDDVYVVPEPRGVVLILGPWNYPSFCLIAPLIGAIAAGNCAVLKPSEVAEATSNFFAQMIPMYLDKDCYKVVAFGPEESQELLKEKFDYIFFTGGERIGKHIYKAAAENMTPVTLELGGKSPVFIDNNLSNIELAAKRILWGKCMNAGQTCVAPDYIICTPQTADRFIAACKEILVKFFGANNNNNNRDFGRIINSRQFNRLKNMLNTTKGNIVIGGTTDATSKYIEMTIVDNVTRDDPLMQDEIFGPILPIVHVQTDTEAIDMITKGSEPLILYVFSEDSRLINRFSNETTSGGFVCNDTLIQLSLDSLPFGGKGHSGLGAYLGKHTFESFSHMKSVVVRNLNPLMELAFEARYPPYTEENCNMIRDTTDKSQENFPRILIVLVKIVYVVVCRSIGLIKKRLFRRFSSTLGGNIRGSYSPHKQS